MATVYHFKVECCSAFCAYPSSQIQAIIEKALKDYENPDSGLKLESISVKEDIDVPFYGSRHRR